VIGRNLLILGSVLALAGCGSARSTSEGGGGLFGTVRIAPATPVCRTGSSCTRPARAFRLVFSANGRTVTATTDHNGRYRVSLDRGRYRVRAGAGAGFAKRGLDPQAVRVTRGPFARRDFEYDPGIR
jgi:hypothetical protein